MPRAYSRAGAALRAWRAPDALVLTVFVASFTLGALLLWAIQPVFAHSVLPWPQGMPAEWPVIICFFQAALLAGYACAHVLTRLAGAGMALIAHLAVLVVALLAQLSGIAEAGAPPLGEGTSLWGLGLRAVSLGLPVMALAGGVPLLQAWFARAGHPRSGDPYFLYGASNLGGLLALLAYPTLIEPGLMLAGRTGLWSASFQVVVLLVGASGGLMLMRLSPPPSETATFSPPSPETARVRDRLAWLGLAFVASGLLVAVTSHLATQIEAGSLLSGIPLALYLLSFVIVFQHRPLLPHWLMLAVQPTLVALLVVSMQMPLAGAWTAYLTLHLIAFFIAAMVCHGELARRRPATVHLTVFYLWMALGGLLGGLFAGVIAPRVLSVAVEYPLLIVLALFARPGLGPVDLAGAARATGWGALIFMTAAGPKLLFGIEIIESRPDLYIVVIAIVGLLIILARPDTARLGAVVAASLLAGYVLMPGTSKSEAVRGFFGAGETVERPAGQAFQIRAFQIRESMSLSASTTER